MKLFRHLFFALLVTSAYSLNAEYQPNSEASAESNYRDHDCDDRCKLQGTYAYELSGFIGPTSPADIAINEAGSLSFDGRGNGTGRGVSAISITPYRLDPVYAFTYVWIAPNVALASGIRTSALGQANIQFAIGVGDKCEHLSLVLLPNSSIQTGVQASYNFVQVSGEAAR